MFTRMEIYITKLLCFWWIFKCGKVVRSINSQQYTLFFLPIKKNLGMTFFPITHLSVTLISPEDDDDDDNDKIYFYICKKCNNVQVSLQRRLSANAIIFCTYFCLFFIESVRTVCLFGFL